MTSGDVVMAAIKLAGAVLLMTALVLIVALLDRPVLPPCKYEDGSGGPTPCIWNAQHRGNSKGSEVIVTTEP